MNCWTKGLWTFKVTWISYFLQNYSYAVWNQIRWIPIHKGGYFGIQVKKMEVFVQPCLSLYNMHLVLNSFPLHYPKRFRNGNSKMKIKPKDWFDAKVYKTFYDPLVSRLSLWFAQETCETIEAKLSSNKMAPTPNEVGATSVSGTTNGCPYPPVAPIPNVSRKKSSKSRHPSGQTWARICLILKVTVVCDWESSRLY